MQQFYFRARVVYDDVMVVVDADNAEEARKKAEEGEWFDAELHTASRADWKIGRQAMI